MGIEVITSDSPLPQSAITSGKKCRPEANDALEEQEEVYLKTPKT